MTLKKTSLEALGYTLLLLACLPAALSAQLSIAATGTPYTTNFNSYTGAGFQPTPGTGQLSSNTWSLGVFSDAPTTLPFGGTATTAGTDYNRGTLTAATSTGGVFARQIAAGNNAIWFQPTGADFFSNSFLAMRMQNNTGSALSALDIAYDIVYVNDQARSSSFNFQWSTDNTNWTAVASVAFSTPCASTGTTIQTSSKTVSLTGLNIANGSYFYIRWASADDATGGCTSGSRDEFGLDNLVITAPAVSSSSFNFASASATFNESAGTYTGTISLSQAANCSVDVTLSGTSTATNAQDFTFSSPTTITATAGGGTSLTFTVPVTDDATPELAETMVFTLSNATGNCLVGATNTLTVTILSNDLPTVSNIVITELMYNGAETGIDTSEFIELYNNNASAVDLIGCSLSPVTYTFPTSTVIAPGGYVIVCSNLNAFNNRYPGVTAPKFQYSGSMSNAGATVKLLNAFSQTVDSVTYDDVAPWPVSAAGLGTSLVLCSPNTNNASVSNWFAATARNWGVVNTYTVLANPGTTDPGVSCAAPTLAFASAAATVAESAGSATVTVSISNPSDCTVDLVLQTSTATVAQDFTFSSPQTVTFSAGGGSTQTFSLPIVDDIEVENDETIVLSLSNVQGGCTITSPSTFTVTIPKNDFPAVSNIVITEIMYNSPETGTDTLEFIEFYNANATPTRMIGCFINDAVVFNFPDTTIAPGAYFVACVSARAYQAVYGGTAIQWTSGGLTNGGETITLRDGLNNIVDQLTYDDVSPWPTQANGLGRSIVLCSTAQNNALSSNWFAATTPVGVTVNAQAMFANPGAADPGVYCFQTPSLSFVGTSATVNESADSVLLTIQYNGYSNAATSVQVSLAGGTATNGSDFTFTSPTTVTFPAFTVPGSTRTVKVPIARNALTEGAETIQFALGNATNNATLSNTSFTVNINCHIGTDALTVGNITQALDAGNCGATVTFEAQTTNICSSTVTYSIASGSFFPVGSTTVTVTATDAGGNTVTATFSVTVTNDFTPDVAGSSTICEGQSASLTASGGATYLWSNGETTATVQVSPATTTAYTATITDANGCSATAGGSISVNALPNASIIGAAALCAGDTITLTAEGGTAYAWSNGQTTAAVKIFAAASLTVTVTDANGCSATADHSVTVNSPRVATASASGSTCGLPNGSVTLTTDATAFIWSNGATTQDLVNVLAGSYTVTATDANGCTVTANATVTDSDVQAPTIACPSNIAVNTVQGTCGAAVTFAATATDNCSATVTYSHASGSVFPVGATIVTATAADSAGNTATCSFTVTVTDNQVPTLTCPSIVYGTRIPGQPTAVVTFSTTVTDNCSATVSYSHASGSAFPIGSTTVTATATDPGGNTSFCTFIVSVPRYLYVDQTATGGTRSGMNWPNAFLTVQAALAAATSNLDTILVAGGVYSPGATATSTYTLKARVPMYGGFPNGLHPNLWNWNQRNVAANQTVLNGGGVCRRVVTANNIGNDPVMCVFDGFTVQGANGNAVGGGMFVNASAAGQSSAPVVRNCTFQNNTAVNGGGVGVTAVGGTANPTFTNCVISGNSATGLGGGVYLAPTRSGGIAATFGNCAFINNSAFNPGTALARGGALAAYVLGVGSNLSVTINGGSFLNNTSENLAGGIYLYSRSFGNGQMNVNNSTFSGNSAHSGAAITNYSQGGIGTVSVNGGTFYNNVVSFSGGAVRNCSELNGAVGTVNLENCIFTENLSSETGGAVSNIGLRGGGAEMYVSRCKFQENESASRGGAICASASTRNATFVNTVVFTTISNCIFFANNGGLRGGAICNEGTSGAPSVMTIVHSTFVNNSAQIGGAYLASASVSPAAASAMITNSIFWNNTTTDTTGRTFHALDFATGISVTASSLQNALFSDNEKGIGSFVDFGGNIAGDPLFVNLALGDLQLQTSSPCIDAGTGVALTVDFDGNARPQGAGFDMGAFESAGNRPMARQPQTTSAAPLTATVFPNPTTGAFTVAFDREVNGFAQLFDLQGRLVASEQLNGVVQAQFDLGDVVNSTYLVRVVSGEAVVTKQIVVLRP